MLIIEEERFSRKLDPGKVVNYSIAHPLLFNFYAKSYIWRRHKLEKAAGLFSHVIHVSDWERHCVAFREVFCSMRTHQIETEKSPRPVDFGL